MEIISDEIKYTEIKFHEIKYPILFKEIKSDYGRQNFQILL